MEKQVKLGRTRSIGLSNFNEDQILAIWENAEIKPSNLQVNEYRFKYNNSYPTNCIVN